MVRCYSCNKKTRLLEIECKWCKNLFCTSCIAIEAHSCSGKDLCKSAKQELLEKQLDQYKTVSSNNYVKF